MSLKLFAKFSPSQIQEPQKPLTVAFGILIYCIFKAKLKTAVLETDSSV